MLYFSKMPGRADRPGIRCCLDLLHIVRNDYLADFLRLAKNRPAAAIMIRHPPMVKIVVPIPPVEGRLETFVFLISVVVVSPLSFTNFPSLPTENVLLIEPSAPSVIATVYLSNSPDGL